MLRISSGKLRGRRLIAPEGGLKPTSDKVRQALFNTLRPRINGVNFLDLFAGSGSVGLTALSEGAAFAAFIEHDPRTYQALRQNCFDLNLDKEAYTLFKTDARRLEGMPLPRFDIIFADPFYPEIDASYVAGLHAQALPLLEEGGVFILEHASRLKHEALETLSGYGETKKYGDTSLSFFAP